MPRPGTNPQTGVVRAQRLQNLLVHKPLHRLEHRRRRMNFALTAVFLRNAPAGIARVVAFAVHPAPVGPADELAKERRMLEPERDRELKPGGVIAPMPVHERQNPLDQRLVIGARPPRRRRRGDAPASLYK